MVGLVGFVFCDFFFWFERVGCVGEVMFINVIW